MQIRVILDNGHDYSEFEYYSDFNRINAKGIKDEIRKKIREKFGKSALRYTITDFYRID